MSRGRVRQRTKTSTLLNSITTTITTIIITIANIADIMMSPASSWYLPDTAVIIIITTTITIITANEIGPLTGAFFLSDRRLPPHDFSLSH
jgi:hypothetical protein